MHLIHHRHHRRHRPAGTMQRSTHGIYFELFCLRPFVFTRALACLAHLPSPFVQNHMHSVARLHSPQSSFSGLLIEVSTLSFVHTAYHCPNLVSLPISQLQEGFFPYPYAPYVAITDRYALYGVHGERSRHIGYRGQTCQGPRMSGCHN